MKRAHGTPGKLTTLKALIPALAPGRRAGGKVVLANGAFDILHVGHVRYLAGAKATGDILVVAVNSDSSVRKLKGAGRPILPEGERMEIVASLGSVDWVVKFNETNVEKVIELLRPDFHAKGTDYTAGSVPERAKVAECGGRVAIVGDPKDHSTTDIISRVRALPA
jgi:rfaE bifunctional protein nucleotidyltransferase chain/domain